MIGSEYLHLPRGGHLHRINYRGLVRDLFLPLAIPTTAQEHHDLLPLYTSHTFHEYFIAPFSFFTCVGLSEAPPGSLTGQLPTLTTDPATPPNSSGCLIYSPSTHKQRNRTPSDAVKESLSGGRYTTAAWALVTERGFYQEETLR